MKNIFFCCIMRINEMSKRRIRAGEKMKLKRMRRTCIAALLVCAVTVTPVLAAPDTLENIQNQKDNLEDQKSNAQDELSSLQEELNTLISKAAELEDKLISTGQEISQAAKKSQRSCKVRK